MRTIADQTKVNFLSEQYVPDNVFIYVAGGAIRVIDVNRTYTYRQGDACLARKNSLVKYEVLSTMDSFLPIMFCFDETFLKKMQDRFSPEVKRYKSADALIDVPRSELLESFIQSIKPYYKGIMQLEEAFEDVKYQELLIILLKNQPQLADILFDFRKPGKIDLEGFMIKNFKFNVGIDKFAFLTGRSISSFKRDFSTIFSDTPSHWLTQKRLDEAHFQLTANNSKPSDIYIDLGFETLSHFSFAFKKRFGYPPTEFPKDRATRTDR